MVFQINFLLNLEINKSINQHLFCYQTLQNNTPLSPPPRPKGGGFFDFENFQKNSKMAD
jgi:hypothetical protein